MPELVTTIIPVYNREYLISECIESVLNQTYRPIEIVVVDDGSNDGTLSVINRFAKKHPEIIVVSQNNAGVGLAREAGRQCASGQYIQYLDSDDVILKDKFTKQVEALQKNPDCDIAYCITSFRKRSGEIISDWKKTGTSYSAIFPEMLVSRWWGTSSPLYRRSVVDQNGPWLDLSNEEDWEYDCRLGKMDVKLVHVKEILSEHRDHEGDRLSNDGDWNSDKLKDRAVAHEIVTQHAIDAGMPIHSTEMIHLSRELFLLSRRSGLAGLSSKANRLLKVSESISTNSTGMWLQYRLYKLGACMIGWQLMGRLSGFHDKYLSGFFRKQIR